MNFFLAFFFFWMIHLHCKFHLSKTNNNKKWKEHYFFLVCRGIYGRVEIKMYLDVCVWLLIFIYIYIFCWFDWNLWSALWVPQNGWIELMTHNKIELTMIFIYYNILIFFSSSFILVLATHTHTIYFPFLIHEYSLLSWVTDFWVWRLKSIFICNLQKKKKNNTPRHFFSFLAVLLLIFRYTLQYKLWSRVMLFVRTDMCMYIGVAISVYMCESMSCMSKYAWAVWMCAYVFV